MNKHHPPTPLLGHHRGWVFVLGVSEEVSSILGRVTMSVHKYTPGPWESGKAYSTDKNFAYAMVFTPMSTESPHTPRAAEALGLTKEEAQANARLIAAAPDLLDACVLAEECTHAPAGMSAEEINRKAEEVRKALRDAIAKATGVEG